MSVPYRISDKSISILIGTSMKVVDHTHANFAAIKAEVLGAKRVDVLKTLIDIKTFIAKATLGHVQISDDEVRLRGVPVHGMIAARLIEHVRLCEPIGPIVAFLEKVSLNPDPEVREDLFAWTERANMPIAEDGDFFAWKTVASDYTSVYKNHLTFNHTPGNTLSMPREDCDGNRNSTCSTGLHFCSYDYLPHYGGAGNRVVLLKINPADVVAIPVDYDLSKGRACSYLVVGEVDPAEVRSVFGDRLVLSGKTGEGFAAGSLTRLQDELQTALESAEEEDEPEHDFDDGYDDYFEEDDEDFEDEDSAFENWTYPSVSVNDSEESIEPVKPREGGEIFRSKDREFFHEEIAELLKEHGQRGTSRLTGIPRATLYGWAFILKNKGLL